jgi:single-stranded DNA-binding protein
VNSLHLIGRLATDVEVKEVNGGSKVSSFILAVDRNAEEADFALLQQKVESEAPRVVGPVEKRLSLSLAAS